MRRCIGTHGNGLQRGVGRPRGLAHRHGRIARAFPFPQLPRIAPHATGAAVGLNTGAAVGLDTGAAAHGAHIQCIGRGNVPPV